jgi:hypothetical protein
MGKRHYKALAEDPNRHPCSDCAFCPEAERELCKATGWRPKNHDLPRICAKWAPRRYVVALRRPRPRP